MDDCKALTLIGKRLFGDFDYTYSRYWHLCSVFTIIVSKRSKEGR